MWARRLRFAVLVVLLALPTVARAATTNYRASLDGIGASPSNDSSGTAVFTYDDGTKTLCGKIAYANVSDPATGATLALATGAAASDGGIVDAVVSPLPGTSPFGIIATLSDDEATTLANGGYVFNVQTTLYATPGHGELRGTVVRGGDGASCPVLAAVADASVVVDAGVTSNSSAANEAMNSSTQTTDSGCAASGTAPAGGLAASMLLGLAVARWIRRRRR